MVTMYRCQLLRVRPGLLGVSTKLIGDPAVFDLDFRRGWRQHHPRRDANADPPEHRERCGPLGVSGPGIGPSDGRGIRGLQCDRLSFLTGNPNPAPRP